MNRDRLSKPIGRLLGQAPDRLVDDAQLTAFEHRLDPRLLLPAQAPGLALLLDLEGGQVGKGPHHAEIPIVQGLVGKRAEAAEHAEIAPSDMRSGTLTCVPIGTVGDRHGHRHRHIGRVGDEFRQPPGKDVAAIDIVAATGIAGLDQMFEARRVDMAENGLIADELRHIGDLEAQMGANRLSARCTTPSPLVEPGRIMSRRPEPGAGSVKRAAFRIVRQWLSGGG